MPQIVLKVPLLPLALARLRSLPGVTVHELPAGGRHWEMPGELVQGTEILLCKLPPRNLDALSSLKLIQIVTVGYEHLKEHGFADRSIQVCNARGLFDVGIAEWNVAMMISLARNLRGMIRNQEHGVWDRPPVFGSEIRGRILGLWGYGGIGRETARLAKTMGLAVHVMTRQGIRPRTNFFCVPGTGDPEGTLPDYVFVAGQERAFLEGLDFLVLAMPQTQTSAGMIGEEELRALPRHAFVLNPARGPLIREETLLRALRERWIAGAALDTHYAYPLPPDHPLWRFPNVILTPHISGIDTTTAFPARMGQLFVENVERYLAGQPLLNELTRQEWLEA
jgi:phosphoglycerate dehydrogenase-like enzyme